MLVDVISRYSLRDKIHAKLHGYKLPETPVRIQKGCYLVNSYSDVDCLLMRVFEQTKDMQHLSLMVSVFRSQTLRMSMAS